MVGKKKTNFELIFNKDWDEFKKPILPVVKIVEETHKSLFKTILSIFQKNTGDIEVEYEEVLKEIPKVESKNLRAWREPKEVSVFDTGRWEIVQDPQRARYFKYTDLDDGRYVGTIQYRRN